VISIRLRHGHELGIAAVGVAAGRPKVVTEVFLATLATAAFPTCGKDPGDADPITESGSGCPSAERLDPPDDLMAEDDRQVRRGCPSLDLVQLGVADAAGVYLILVSNAGIQIVSPVVSFPFDQWKRMLAVHLDGAFLTTRACLRHMYRAGSGSIVYIGSVHSKEASPLKAPYVTAKHGLIGLCRVVAKEGAKYNVRANVVCPSFVRTPLVEKQIPEQARELGITEDEVVKNVMLSGTVDGEFTTSEEVTEAVLYFAGAETNALTGQSLVVSHGWFMQ